MKLIHLSDLHIGKRVNEFSMIEDQNYILKKIINIIDDEKPDGIIIAGDVYDKSVPSAEAVQLFDDFLFRLAERKLQVYIISGNHDSPERLAFGGKIMDISGIHISPVYNGETVCVTQKDEYGIVNIYLLPFLKPAHIRRFFPDEEIESYTDAIRVAVGNMQIDKSQRNLIVTHQFVTGATTSDSEELSVGGSDNVDVSVFDDFDYVALGHIHGPQKMSRETVRYCGTPLKYSFSEANHKKSVTIVDLAEKGNITVRTTELVPLRDMREIKGAYMEITDKRNYQDTNTEDYMHITLTDEEDIFNAIGNLRTIYPNIMKLDYDNRRTRSNATVDVDVNIEKKSPVQLFSEFYEMRNNQPMSDEQRAFTSDLIEKIWEDEQ